MSATAVRSPVEFESQLQRFRYERMEEARAVRVGEKEVSESAEIVARYAELFTREQRDALRDAEEAAEGDDRERLYRLRKMCEAGLVEREIAAAADALENKLLAARVNFRGEELPLRAASARVAVLPAYGDREELGLLAAERSAELNDDRMTLLRRTEQLEADVSGEPDPIARAEEEKGVSLGELAAVLAEASARLTDAYVAMRGRWLDRILGSERDETPMSFHVGYLRRLSPLASTYSKERSVDVCLETLRAIGFDLAEQPNIKLDLDDRPQKSPRACVIPSDPPHLVHLITRAQGGLHDYQAFLHEAGHALHYAGSNDDLPFTFRAIARDHALTEIYSFIVEAISRESGWHERHFGLSREQAAQNSEAASLVELLLFRRYAAKLQYELEFWGSLGENGGMADRYSELLTSATGIRYRPDAYLSDMDAGFYSADYLRAWVRSSQLREHVRRETGDEWWCDPRTGDLLRSLFAEGTRPSSEQIAEQLGFDPLDTGPLVRSRGA
ncbi:MAG: hypothetical protein ICV59_04530 [Thermoleophilia bacterium]|nr:hypothetical protein [Thermoleophilia bacterium]